MVSSGFGKFAFWNEFGMNMGCFLDDFEMRDDFGMNLGSLGGKAPQGVLTWGVINLGYGFVPQATSTSP